MSYVVKEYGVRVEHVTGCERSRLCGPACVRVTDGFEADFRISFPGASRAERHRERVPREWSKTKAKAERWASQRETYWIARGPEEERSKGDTMSVAQLATEWIAERKALGIDYVVKEERRLAQHVLPLLGTLKVSEVRPRHARDLVVALRSTPSRKGGKLAPRTVRAVFATTKQMFQYAVAQEYVTGNPVVLVDRSVLPKKEDKDPSWRSGAVFSKDEVEQLLSDPRVAPHRRVAYAIEFLTGLRTGQVSALRWGDWQRDVAPLGKLTSSQSYDSHAKRVKATKTRVAYEVPVHPTLATVLAGWKLMGWRDRHGRSPKPDDLVVPTIHGGYRDVRKALEDFDDDLRRLGLRKRRHYDARRTFTSLALSGRASKDVVKYLTHPRPADAFDLYVTPTWEALSEAVTCIPVALRAGEVVELRPAPSAPGFGANEAREERAG